MAGTGPKQADTPLELLTNHGTVKPPFLYDVWGYLVGGVLGFGGALYGNYATKRPIVSGVHRTAAVTVVSALLGNYFDDLKKDYDAERDAVLRHYVQLHPEDFPPFERKKYAEVLEPWVPIR
ncbi:NADH dehydrogenase [ubiquinone] 1 subunit C2 [Coccinella septempunctata]|uniref:NADH dehydrogenase [ubiquinone] 1 subunit C2 n=1 Tax=Coccinella septempunctata TaxID=41139 RepID=UPI001D080BBD|nr:NADH dehydrogenase [ubiquinone] 1 subunit C2 [Coccinella septempunctata]